MRQPSPEEQEFLELYGPWQPWSIDQAARHLAGIDAPWWICGGYAIEAFTGARREHDDLDIGMFGDDLPALRSHFAGSLHLWSAGSRSLRPIDDRCPDLHEGSSHVWLREHALSAWCADVLMTPRHDGEWVLELDTAVTMSLDAATWVDDQGRRVLKPELVLAHKAKLGRAKDDADFAVTWPLLDGDARRWLHETVRRLFPRHPWLSRMVAPDQPVDCAGSTVRLREILLDDAAQLDAWGRDPAAGGEFNDFGMPRAEPLRTRVEQGWRMVSPGGGKLVIERLADGVLVGDVTWHSERYGPNPESEALNIGIALLPAARGQGYGAEAQRLLATLLLDLYDVARIEASTDVDNIAEQRALEKAGFVREGVLRQAQFRAGAFHDLMVFAVVRGGRDDRT